MNFETYNAINEKNPIEFILLAMEALKELEKNPAYISKNKKLNHIQNLLLKKMMTDTVYTGNLFAKFPVFPNNYHALFELFMTPLGQWNVFEKQVIKNKELEEFVFMDDIEGVTDEGYRFLVKEKSQKEYRGLPVQRALVYCREQQRLGKDYQEAYVNFRTFLIERPLLKHMREINDHKPFLNNDAVLMQFLVECYESFNDDIFKHKCQNCGWTTYKRGTNEYVCVREKCKKSLELSTLKQFEIPKNQYVKRVLDAIQFSTVIPGIGELQLAKKLRKKGWEVALYPNLEYDGDLKAEKNGKTIYIDCKDYVSWRDLRDRIVEDVKENKYRTDIVIAIPDENVKENPRYLSNLRTSLTKKAIQIPVMKFSEIGGSQK